MDSKNFSKPIDLRSVEITDGFMKKVMETVRKEVITYQWEALNDRIEGANPSFCMHNYKVAGKMNEEKKKLGDKYIEPAYSFKGFEALPEDPNVIEDKFYGFVFQDSDFSKWIEAVAYSLTQHPDKELEKIADEAIDIVVAAQQEDGYLDTYYIINGKDKIFTNLKDHHELYCFGHLTEGAVAYYQATGKSKLLESVRKYADYIYDKFNDKYGTIKGYPGHEIVEMALVRLYEITNCEKYLALSKLFIDRRGQKPYYFDSENHEADKATGMEIKYSYYQAHKPVREQDEAVGHAVRAVYLYSGMADIARLTGDESLYLACEKLWDSITKRKMYITGGIGATHVGESFSFDYDLPNDTAYNETCAAIGLAFFARRMLEIKPDSKYANVIERLMYNGILSGMDIDGKSFFYVNPLEVNPIACKKDERKFHVKPIRQKWFGCACCPPNLARFISSIASYGFTRRDETLFVHLYLGSKISKKIGDKLVNVNIESNFPWNGKVKITINAKDTNFVLALRIPDWCDKIPEGLSDLGKIKDGYLYITKEWKDEDVIEFEFDLKPKFVKSNPKVSENAGKVALMYGPVVYCLEEVDNGKDLHLITADRNSSFDCFDYTIKDLKVVKIKAKGKRIAGNNENAELFFEQKVKNSKECISDSNDLLKEQKLESCKENTFDDNQSLYDYVENNSFMKEETKEVDLEFIPYFAWANRGENEMTVWVRE